MNVGRTLNAYILGHWANLKEVVIGVFGLFSSGRKYLGALRSFTYLEIL